MKQEVLYSFGKTTFGSGTLVMVSVLSFSIRITSLLQRVLTATARFFLSSLIVRYSFVQSAAISLGHTKECLASKPSGHRLFNMLHIWLMTLRHSSFYNISCLARRSIHPFKTLQTANLYRKTTAISSKLRWSWRRRRDLNPRGSYPTLLP